jgi:hypothetical protein
MQSWMDSKPMDVFLTEYQAEIKHWVSTGDLKPGAVKALNETLVKLRTRFGATLLYDIATNELFQVVPSAFTFDHQGVASRLLCPGFQCQSSKHR